MGARGSGFTGLFEHFNGEWVYCQETLFFPFGWRVGTRWQSNVPGNQYIQFSTTFETNIFGEQWWALNCMFRWDPFIKLYRLNFPLGFPQPIPATLTLPVYDQSLGWSWGGDPTVEFQRGDYDVVPFDMCT